MKKLLVICLALVTLSTTAQTHSFRVTKTYLAYYNKMTSSYDYDNTTYPENMYIVLKNNTVYVTDKAHSAYTLGEKIETENKDCVTYSATDEKDRFCGMSACNSDGQKSFVAMYPDQYYIIYYVKDND